MPKLKRNLKHHATAVASFGKFTSVRGRRGEWRCYLQVLNQSFAIGSEPLETKEQAEWMRVMLCAALMNLANQASLEALAKLSVSVKRPAL